jgi:hypothetical protein
MFRYRTEALFPLETGDTWVCGAYSALSFTQVLTVLLRLREEGYKRVALVYLSLYLARDVKVNSPSL